MTTPLQGYQQQVDPHSTTSTVLGFGYETARWSTWRNPWFLERIGKEGWDPAGKGVMSWLDRNTGGLVNKILAPLAGEDYDVLTGVQKRAEELVKYAAKRDVRTVVQNFSPSVFEGLHSTLDDPARARPAKFLKQQARKGGKKLGISGESVERVIQSRGAKRGFWHSIGIGSGRTEAELLVKNRVEAKIAAGGASKYAAGVAGAGRLLRGANVTMWGFEIGKLFMGGFKAVANVGAQSRMVPHATTGSGIQDNYMAATLRQSSLMDMYSSEYGNRRQMGNEARFLHS